LLQLAAGTARTGSQRWLRYVARASSLPVRDSSRVQLKIGVKQFQDARFASAKFFVGLLARQASDGTWKRIYGFADGRVVTARSHDGNFDTWEK